MSGTWNDHSKLMKIISEETKELYSNYINYSSKENSSTIYKQLSSAPNKIKKVGCKQENSIKEEVNDASINYNSILNYNEGEYNNIYRAVLKLSLDDLKGSDFISRIVLASPLQLEAIIKRTRINVWELHLRKQENVVDVYSLDWKIERNSFIQMFHDKEIKTIKSNENGTLVAKLIVRPGADILYAKEDILIYFDIYEL